MCMEDIQIRNKEDSSPTIRIIKKQDDELYLTPHGLWSCDIEDAAHFRTSAEVVEAIERYQLRNAEVVSYFRNPHYA